MILSKIHSFTFAVVAGVVLYAQPLLASTMYFVGNSLTWDANPNRIKAITQSAGKPLDVGYHIQCSAQLTTIWSSPTTCITPPVTYGDVFSGLPNHAWDTVSLQTYYDTLPNALTNAQRFIDLTRTNAANANTRTLIYSAWFDQSTTPFRDRWALPYSTANRMNGNFFAQLMTGLRDDPKNAGKRVDLVPVGEVLAELDKRLAVAPVAGISSVYSLYRDPYHMNETGKILAAMTFYSVMYGDDPANATYTISANDTLTPQMMPLIQDVVWDVVRANEFTSVPEPSSAALLLVSGLMLLRRRRH